MKKFDITAEVKRALVDLGVVAKRPAYSTIDDWCLISGMSSAVRTRRSGAAICRRSSAALALW